MKNGILFLGIFLIFFQSLANSSVIFDSPEECELKTGKQCGFVTCDYIPAGKTFEEVCGRDFKEGWSPSQQTAVDQSVDQPKEVFVPNRLCQSSADCTDDSICDISRPSWAMPRGLEKGVVAMGDALCHHPCGVDADCQSRGYGKCVTKQLFEGDVAQIVHFCEEPIQR